MSDTTNPTEPTADKPADSKPNGDATGDKSPNGGDKLFSQAELDAKVEDRLARERKQAEGREAKAREQAAADALKEQGEFKKLSETQGETLKTLTAEKETLTAERDAAQGDAAKYKKVVESLIAKHMDGVPEHIRPLLAKQDLVEQLDWIAANQGQIKVNGVPQTPKPDGAGLSAAQKEAVQKQTDRDYRRSF